MRRFIFATACLAFLGASNINSLKASKNVNCNSPVFKKHALCQKSKGTVKINTDVNIKGDKKRYVFNELIPAAIPPNTQIFYDRESKGSGCNLVGKCLKTGGVIAKWSNYFLELQPYQITTGKGLLNRARTIQTAPRSIWIQVSEKQIEVPMINRETNQYYLPLSLRKRIAQNSSVLTIELEGTMLTEYKGGDKARPLLNSIINTTNELKEYIGKSSRGKSKADRLKELKNLLDQGLINRSEYKEGRQKIIND